MPKLDRAQYGVTVRMCAACLNCVDYNGKVKYLIWSTVQII